MKVKKGIFLCFISLMPMVWTSCEREAPMEEMIPMDTGRDIPAAVAVLHPTEGSDVHGTVTFTKAANSIRIMADVYGLIPGKHGFHIHEFGDCSAPDAASAGGHFNPDNMPHGAPDDMNRHVGDLGNLVADEEGNARYERKDSLIAFSGDHSIIGLAVVVHAGEDDLTSQPSGNAGPRVACGVIGIAK